jgi:predicted outer membrane protein
MKNQIWKQPAAACLSAAVLAILSLPLCAQDTPAESAPTGTEQRQGTGVLPPTNDQAAPSRQQDIDFMQRAYQASRAQVDMGNLALQNASSEGVKRYAQKVVDDFTRAGEELRAIAGPATPQNNMTTQALARQDYRTRSQYEKEQYPYLKNNPYLLEEMENFNVGGSGLGTSGGTTGTAVSRPARPRNPTNSRPRPAIAGVGAGTGTGMGTGTGSMRTANTDSIPDQMVNTTATMVSGDSRDNANALGRNEGRTDSRSGISGPQPAAGSRLSEELPADYQATKDKLSFLTGADFDREYLKAAKNSQTELKNMLQLQLSAGGDQQAKQWAEKYLSLMQAYQPPVLNTGKSKANQTKASSSGW